MGKLLVALTIAACWLQRCKAWKCDARCPIAAYLVCLEEEANKTGNRRDLQTPLETIESTKNGRRDRMVGHKDTASPMPVREPAKSLRGSQQERRLQTTYFQLKLYHEPGYCWQSEWDDREWCAECKDECDEWDYLELKHCESDEDKQYYTYESMPNGIGGRIKPKTNESLCWERTRVNAHQLRPCDDINGVVNVTQIFRDFDWANQFELHPFNRGDNTTHPDGPMCLTNHHHPKSEEVIRAETCDGARADYTNFWIAHNAYTEGVTNSAGTPSPSPQPSSLPSMATTEAASSTSTSFAQASTTDTEPATTTAVATEVVTTTTAQTTMTTDPSTTATTSAPVIPTMAPVVPTVAPVTPTPAPVLPPSLVPVDPTLSPVAPTPSPLVPTAAPVVPSPAPVAPTSSPVVATPAPVAQASTVPTPVPIVPTSSPIAPTASPVDPTTAPVFVIPSPRSSPAPTTTAVQSGQGQGIPVLDLGWDGCSIFDKCPQCVGDCDNDAECDEGLICYKRSPNTSVPTCIGGEDIHHEKDFCIPADWDSR